MNDFDYFDDYPELYDVETLYGEVDHEDEDYAHVREQEYTYCE